MLTNKMDYEGKNSLIIRHAVFASVSRSREREEARESKLNLSLRLWQICNKNQLNKENLQCVQVKFVSLLWSS